MNHRIYYFTGTGNSLYVARKLEEILLGTIGGGDRVTILPITSLSLEGEAEASPSAGEIDPFGTYSAPLTSRKDPLASSGTEPLAPTDAVGLVFPVHAWGVPRIILRALPALQGAGYYYALAVNAGQVANTLVQLKKEMEKHGMELSSGFSIRMPSNYLPFGGAEPEEVQERCFRDALEKLKTISGVVRERALLPVEKGPLWQNVILSGLNALSAPHFSTMDKRFIVEDSCTSCGICVQVCPVGNIHLQQGRPVWNHHCEQCYACIQWCPVEAIQYGKGTKGKKRYHHPEISIKDLVVSGR